MKKFTELNLGFNDAENFKERQSKELLVRYFIKTDELYSILKPNNYFLIGDKGTGKTAYSLFLSNLEFKNTQSHLNYIRETEYVKFIKLKAEKHLTLTEFTSIWKVLIYILISQQVQKAENDNVLFSKFSKFRPLQDAINEFYNSAFSPEIINALNVIDESKEVAEILHKFFKLSGEDKKTTTFSESKFQMNLLYIQNKFETALSSLKLEKDHILFIDGLDIRPRNINFEDYLECVKGLANAVWALNSDFFSQIRNSKGRLKVVILVRPDIFSQLGLQNLNNKIRDNSVLLDWRTTYPSYRTSSLFKMSDNILSSQQNSDKQYPFGECWDYYFPFKNQDRLGRENDSFVSFLRFSMFKPRDIITLLKILQESLKMGKDRKLETISEQDFESGDFRARYSDYLLGEIKDYLAFYHSDKDYELFLKFFEYLNGKASFDYSEYMTSYDQFANHVEKNQIVVPIYFESSDMFLQFLFDLNVICYIEDTIDQEPHIHWSYRERTYSNINPKVKEGVRYQIHYGLQKAFNTGKVYEKRIVKKTRRIDN
jgi:hypothetical protein